ncbi:MAG: elongation factor P [Patescibacteria group bacterium]
MIDVNHLRNGTAFELDGQPFIVMKYEFTKMGRGNATIKVKVRNLQTQAVTIKSFSSGNVIQDISLKRKKMQFLYNDQEGSWFMDPVSFEQAVIDKEVVADQKPYLADGMEVQVLFWVDKPLAVELPPKLILTVKETGPGEKGNSVSNMYKTAVMSNGLEMKVPLFIKTNEAVVVDTRNGEYVSRA